MKRAFVGREQTAFFVEFIVLIVDGEFDCWSRREEAALLVRIEGRAPNNCIWVCGPGYHHVWKGVGVEVDVVEGSNVIRVEEKVVAAFVVHTDDTGRLRHYC